MAHHPDLSAVRRNQGGVHRLAVLVVSKADRAVVAPLPCAIGANGGDSAILYCYFQLGQQLGLGAVLVEQPPGPTGTPVPAVRQLDGEGIFPILQQQCHIVGLVLHPLAVVGVAGGQDEIAHPVPVELCLVQPAGGDVEPGLFDTSGGEALAEAVYGVTVLFPGGVVSGDPVCCPGFIFGKPRLKTGLGPVARLAGLVPQADLPGDGGARGDGFAAPRRPHGGAFHPAAVPESVSAVIGGGDLPSGLGDAALAVPEQPGAGKVDAYGVQQVFRF